LGGLNERSILWKKEGRKKESTSDYKKTETRGGGEEKVLGGRDGESSSDHNSIIEKAMLYAGAGSLEGPEGVRITDTCGNLGTGELGRMRTGGRWRYEAQGGAWLSGGFLGQSSIWTEENGTRKTIGKRRGRTKSLYW